MGPFFRLSAIIIGLSFLQGCAGTAQYNPTVYPFEMKQELLDQSEIKTVVIAHINLGAPSRKYLEREAPRIDAAVSAYLKENGYKVVPQRQFKQLWNTGVRAFGNPVDPTTGRVNMKTFSQIIQTVRDEMRKSSKIDAFIFTDLLELEVSFGGGMKHTARWDGVAREPSLQGPGQGVTGGFDWSKQAAVASLMVNVFNMDLQRVFLSRGGLDTTDAIDTRSSSTKFVRRRAILENKNHLLEGIQLAFHPLIPMEKYPGVKP